eukprot:1371982-Amphidinium_carterae.1
MPYVCGPAVGATNRKWGLVWKEALDAAGILGREVAPLVPFPRTGGGWQGPNYNELTHVLREVFMSADVGPERALTLTPHAMG